MLRRIIRQEAKMFGIGVFEMLLFALIVLLNIGVPLITLALVIWLVMKARRTDKRD